MYQRARGGGGRVVLLCMGSSLYVCWKEGRDRFILTQKPLLDQLQREREREVQPRWMNLWMDGWPLTAATAAVVQVMHMARSHPPGGGRGDRGRIPLSLARTRSAFPAPPGHFSCFGFRFWWLTLARICTFRDRIQFAATSWMLDRAGRQCVCGPFMLASLLLDLFRFFAVPCPLLFFSRPSLMDPDMILVNCSVEITNFMLTVP